MGQGLLNTLAGPWGRLESKQLRPVDLPLPSNHGGQFVDIAIGSGAVLLTRA